ncbi:MarR family winged helix-turn-helix transcriptional regulator [Arthrobacter psychrolactophilus]
MSIADESSAAPALSAVEENEMAEVIKTAQQNIGTLLIRARKSLGVRATMIHPDLKPMAFSAMMLLSRCGSMHQVTLTQQLDTDKAVVSRLLKQLEELGLISRTADPADGRAMIVALTQEAHERYEATQESARQTLFNRLSKWDLEEVRLFSKLLAHFNEELD